MEYAGHYDEEFSDNQNIGSDSTEETSESYDSESSAPLTQDGRNEVLEGMAGRSVWESANETGDPTGNEVENGPDVDPNDPNLSATFAEAGADERKESLGMRDEEPFLDDPEIAEEESDHRD